MNPGTTAGPADDESMQGIALNFLPVLTRDFRITMYAVPSRGEERPVYAGERAVLRRLKEGEEYKPYWTLFEPFDGAIQVDLEPSRTRMRRWTP